MENENENEANIYWEENIDNAVVTKEIFLTRVENWIEFDIALTKFKIDTTSTLDETETETEKVDEAEVDEDDYFSQIVWEVEKDWEDLAIFWENIKAPLWA